jgi:uncharacterized protein
MAQTDLDLIRAFYAALRTLDLAALFDVLAPDVQIRHSELVAWGGEERGYPGVRRFLERLVLTVDARFDVTEIVNASDTVVTGRLRGRARATGAWFDVRFVHIWTIDDGRLARLDAHVDTAALRHALEAPEWRAPAVTTPAPRAGGRGPRHDRRRTGACAASTRAQRWLALAPATFTLERR